MHCLVQGSCIICGNFYHLNTCSQN